MRSKVAVSRAELPEDFPVLVMTRGPERQLHEVHVVWGRELASFLAEHPVHRFTVPAEEEERLRVEVEQATRAKGRTDSPLWFATFKVQHRPDGSQVLEVHGTGDDDYENTAFYTARDTSFEPHFHRWYFGGGAGVGAGAFAFVGSPILNGVIWLAVWGVRRLRRRAAA